MVDSWLLTKNLPRIWLNQWLRPSDFGFICTRPLDPGMDIYFYAICYCEITLLLHALYFDLILLMESLGKFEIL